jgi:hypothetical protein
MSKGKAAYERDVKSRPTYHDGTPRKAWEDLCNTSKWSWERASWEVLTEEEVA